MLPDTVVPLHPTGGAIPLYCLPSASGSAYTYAPLVPLLDDDQPLYGLEAPGFDDEDQKPLTTVAELAEAYLGTIAQLRPGEPVALLGWSMGGVIAFDMAQRLQAAGTPAHLLIVVDTPVPVRMPVPPRHLVLRRFASDLTGAAPLGEQNELDRVLAGRSDEEPIEHAFDALTDAGVIPSELDAEMLAMRYAVFHANITALHGYEPFGGLRAPMVVVRAEESPAERMDWTGLAASVTAAVVKGDHYTIWRDDGIKALAAVISRSLHRPD